jgi:exopolysaccharide biosynthesis polyprenyl glycosylphosphotransferase
LETTGAAKVEQTTTSRLLSTTHDGQIPAWAPRVALISADLLCVAAAMFVAYLLHGVVAGPEPSERIEGYLGIAVVSLPLWFAAFHGSHLYSSRHVSSAVREFVSIFHGVVGGALLATVVAFMFKEPVARSWLVLSGLFALVFVGVERLAARKAFWRLRARGYLLRPVFLLGWNNEAMALCASLLNDPGLGYHVLGIIDDKYEVGEVLYDDCRVLAHPNDTLAIMREYGATGVIIATTAVDTRVANELARSLMEHGFYVELSSSLRDIAAERLMARPLGRFSMISVEPAQLDTWRALAKRSFDMAGALAFLAIMFPLCVIAAIAIKLDSRGPVLFRQVRVGKGGRDFKVVKFRTMVHNAEDRLQELMDLNEADGPLFKIREDPRITRVGRWLRRTSFDEVPQFWNVLRGDMSIVGPRPALPTEVNAWSPELHQRLRVRPGITGMWQVNGRSEATFEDYVRLDLYYVDNWSLLTDLVIVAKTIPTIVTQKGAA